MAQEPLLEVRDLAVAYGSVQVIWGISFRVEEGQVVSIIGSNGAGKTTTLRSLAGLLLPRGGSIRFRGEDITALPAHARVNRQIVLVPEGRQLWPRMTVEENLLLGAFAPAFRGRAQERLARVYDLFPRLKERRRQLAGTLSGGEQQMCAIGRGLMAEPKVLMLDEPSLGLAPKLVEEIFRFVDDISAQGVTILLVEQNVKYALRAADHAYVLETGRITLEGSGRDLLHDDHVRTAYLGGAA
ncbi:ABC transporter ATP-binding protein [Caldinitratiruptor microaerophilus]|uniref:ABC transporter ATP-binding protein n=1 Tax=Caldinitratiruptor microaerophilus TaxID=671077 RepID=A0AA35G5T6_9FIRM|nr:ABC transporter ATP-binding protein [Caldinitratiruptor microaerophilus]BDG60091.1 ABC transporter ATP-binding protein [Caldinitratiruptor microaerophilus]